MKARVDAGSDVAMIGAWDAQRDARPLTAAEAKRSSDTLDAEAAAGHLFLVRTGADGGGPIDLYIDEAIPGEVEARLAAKGGEFLLALPSGALVVDGAEYYRAGKPKVAGTDRVITVPAGEYAVRCYAPSDAEAPSRSEDALRTLVGKADLEYYDRVNRRGCMGGALSLLLFPILSFPLGWQAALVITVGVFLGFFPVFRWLLKRNARYQRLDAIVPAFRLSNEDPTLVLALRPLRDRAALTGGSVSL